MKFWAMDINCLLFGVIGRVGKQARENPACNTVCTFENQTVMISMDEVVVENLAQHTVHQLSATVSQYIRRGPFTSQLDIEIVELVWKLCNNRGEH